MSKVASEYLSKDNIKVANEWLDSSKEKMPERVFNILKLALKLSEAVEHLKFKIKDMISLLAQQMGFAPKSEKGRPSKRFFGIG